MITLQEARGRLRYLQSTWVYAFAMGHGCSVGPRSEEERAVLREVQDLRAIIGEHDDRTR